MALTNSGKATSFGVAGVELATPEGLYIGAAEVPGQFSADITPEVNTTRGGAAYLPQHARSGTSSGEGSLVLRSRPPFIEGELMDATLSTTAADSSVVASGATDVNGSNVASTLTIAVASTIRQAYNVFVEATGAATANVYVVGSGGTQTFNALTLGSTSVSLGQTGISLTAASPSYDPGDMASFSVTPGHNGIDLYRVPQLQKGSYYRLKVWTQEGGPDDALVEWTFNRVHMRGANIAAQDAETQGDVELPLVVCATLDGTDPWERRIITKPV